MHNPILFITPLKMHLVKNCIPNEEWTPNTLNHTDYIDINTDIHPSKRVTQHDFDQLYFFYPGFLFIKLEIPAKACLFAFRLMPYLLGLFHWGNVKKEKLQNWSDCMGNAYSIKFWAFLLWVYARVPTAHSLCWNPPNPFNFATFPFWHCPQFTHPARSPMKQS